LANSASGGSAVESDGKIYTTFDDGLGQILARYFDGTGWTPVFNVTNDPTGGNFNPVAGYFNTTFYKAWTHHGPMGDTTVQFGSYNGATRQLGPIVNVESGASNPQIAVDGSGNPLIISQSNLPGIVLNKSPDGGKTFGPHEVLSTDPNAFSPRIVANGNYAYVGWNSLAAGEIEVATGIRYPISGSPVTIHTGKSGDEFNIVDLIFQGLRDPILVESGANILGPSGTFAFIDYGDYAGNSFNTQTIGTGFSQASVYSRSDGSLEIAALRASDGAVILFQGNPGGTFSQLSVSNANALEVSISSDDQHVYVVQTNGSKPGPIDLFTCQ